MKDKVHHVKFAIIAALLGLTSDNACQATAKPLKVFLSAGMSDKPASTACERFETNALPGGAAIESGSRYFRQFK